MGKSKVWSPSAKVVPCPSWIVAGNNEDDPGVCLKWFTCSNLPAAFCSTRFNFFYWRIWKNHLFPLPPCLSCIIFMLCLSWRNDAQHPHGCPHGCPNGCLQDQQGCPHLKNAGSTFPRMFFAAPLRRQTDNLSPRLRLKITTNKLSGCYVVLLFQFCLCSIKVTQWETNLAWIPTKMVSTPASPFARMAERTP